MRSQGVWRNGSASDSRSEGWEFESLCPHFAGVCEVWQLTTELRCDLMFTSFQAAGCISPNTLMVRLVQLSVCMRCRDSFWSPTPIEQANVSKATPKGFEPLRAEPNGFLVHHLNHSVTVSMEACRCINLLPRRDDLNDGKACSPTVVLSATYAMCFHSSATPCLLFAGTMLQEYIDGLIIRSPCGMTMFISYDEGAALEKADSTLRSSRAVPHPSSSIGFRLDFAPPDLPDF